MYLPVFQHGALVFVGDGHAAQHDGELTGDAVEASTDVEFSAELWRWHRIRAPRAEDAEFRRLRCSKLPARRISPIQLPYHSRLALRTPLLGAFTLRERRIVAAHRTPLAVQRWLRALPYNRERLRPTLRTFRGVVRHGRAQCLEAVLAAATILDQHGWPPLVLDIESQDGLDHVLFLYQHNGRWGTVARSRDAGLHGRRPVYSTIRALVQSYFDPYVDGSGRVTGYGTANLDELVSVDWRLAPHDVRAVERALIRMPHRRIVMPEGRYSWWLRRYERLKQGHGGAPTVRTMRGWYGAQTTSWL